MPGNTLPTGPVTYDHRALKNWREPCPRLGYRLEIAARYRPGAALFRRSHDQRNPVLSTFAARIRLRLSGK